MAISFNNIPTTVRTPGAYTEVDSSRALKGLAANPHKVLILGQMETDGTASVDTVEAITRDSLADGFFGPGSVLARMCNVFKENNPNTELFAMALSEDAAGVAASGNLELAGSASGAGTLFLLVGGVKKNVAVTSGWSAMDVASATVAKVNADNQLCIKASLGSASVGAGGSVHMVARVSGTLGNQFDFRLNYYEGQSSPTGITPSITGMAGGVNNPDIGDAWAVIGNTQYQHIIQPYTDSANLGEIEGELATRFKALPNLQGHGYTGYRGTQASCTTKGNARNSPHVSIMGANGSPTNPEEWAAAFGAVSAQYLNKDPGRPLHFLKLKGVLPPQASSRFTQSERDTLLYDGISTFVVDNGGNVLIEHAITTYQTNALGVPDASYLDLQTLFTLMEIRYQWGAHMSSRFIIPRFKLADDGHPVQPGQKVATPKTVKQEAVSLFTRLRDAGLIENLAEFTENLVVERDATDVNRVNVLLPPDLINQFRVLAAQIQFIL